MRKRNRIKRNEFFNTLIYQQFRDGGDISFDEMASYEAGKNFVFPSLNQSSITSKREVAENPDELRFLSNFSKDAILSRHSHNDCDEWLKVPVGSGGEFLIITGTEKEGTLKYSLLTEEDEAMFIAAGVIHQVSNVGKRDSKLIVKFKKV